MSTKNPRVPVMLTQHQHEVLKAFAARQGVSMSSVISELVEMVVESFERVLELARQADEAGESAKEGIRRAAEAAEKELLPMVGEFGAVCDRYHQQVNSVLKGGGGAADCGPRSGTGAAAQPPGSNTGVRSGESGGASDEIS